MKDVATMQPDPARPGKHIDPDTGIWPIQEWGGACHRGFVSDARFTGGQSTTPVIQRTNRQTTRRWRALNNSKGEQHK